MSLRTYYQFIEQVFLLSSICFITVASYVLRRRLVGHTLSIRRISPLSLTLHDVRYEGIPFGGSFHFVFNASSISIRFHRPTQTLPRWLSFTTHSILYQSENADISTGTLSITFWIFPQLFKQTAGPWTNVEIDDLRLKVKHSSHTPYVIKRLRENLVGAVLGGDIYRLDDFGTTIHFCGLTEKYEKDDGDYACRAASDCNGKPPDANGNNDECIGTPDGSFKTVSCPVLKPPLDCMNPDQDEVRVSAFARGLHLCNNEGRIYTFGAVDAQLRRNWTAERGTFVMIAKESRWIRVHWGYQRQKVMPFWIELFSAIAQFPYNLVHALHYPLTSANIYVHRVDIHFDEFRIRDAELVMQAIGMIREQMVLKNIVWQDVFVDTLIRAFIGSGT